MLELSLKQYHCFLNDINNILEKSEPGEDYVYVDRVFA